MSWHRIDPRHLRQDDPSLCTVAFVSHGELDVGQLVLHLDNGSQVVRFELSCERFLGGREYALTWDSVIGLVVGEVKAYDFSPPVAPRMKGTPIIQRYRRPPAEVVRDLMNYVSEHADALDPVHRDTVTVILAQALVDDAGEPEG